MSSEDLGSVAISPAEIASPSLVTGVCEPSSVIWLVWGSAGEYSDRSEWPVRAYRTEQAAKDEVGRLTAGWRAIIASVPEDDRWDPEHYEPLVARVRALDTGADVHDEPRYYACEIVLITTPEDASQHPSDTREATDGEAVGRPNSNSKAPQ